MATTVLLPRASNSPKKTTKHTTGILRGLRSSSKGRLRYDYEWEASSQALEECCKPPILSAEFLPVRTSFEEVDGYARTLECDEFEVYGEEEYDDPGISANSRFSSRIERDLRKEKRGELLKRELQSSYGGISRVERDLRKEKSAQLLEKELQASYDGTHVAIRQYDKEKELESRQRLQLRKDSFENYSKQLQDDKRRHLQDKEIERVHEFVRSVQEIQEDEKKKSEEARLRQQKLEESHQECAESAVRKVREVEALRMKVLEEEQRNKRELQKLGASLNIIQVTAANIKQTFQECKFQSFLSPSMSELLTEVSKVLQVSKNSLDHANENGKPTDTHVTIMQECSVLIHNILQKAKTLVHEADAKAAKEEAERQAKEEAKSKSEDEKRLLAEKLVAKSPAPSQPATRDQTSAVAPKQKSRITKELAVCISETAWVEYSRLASYKSEIVNAAERLSADKSFKQYKFDLHKAVATPINAISDQSPEHLLDKIQRLTKLLSGQPVQVGNKQISTSSHKAAPAFCRDLLAKKLVQQGSQQVSSSHNSAFPIAAVAIGIWEKFPDVGDLILAHFYDQCPFLVPFYIPQTPGLSDEEYAASLGYLCSEGEIEQQDKFLKRMTGLVRLYAAVISSLPPSGQSKNLSYGLPNGWTWLARMMNLEPRPDYTATALYEFLAVAGHALMREYKKQFGKLLSTLVVDYVPKIEEKTAKAQSGPVSRLRVFLDTCLKEQRIPVPEGYLSPHWWRSSGF